MFGTEPKACLADYIQAALMLAYNNLARGGLSERPGMRGCEAKLFKFHETCTKFGLKAAKFENEIWAISKSGKPHEPPRPAGPPSLARAREDFWAVRALFVAWCSVGARSELGRSVADGPTDRPSF